MGMSEHPGSSGSPLVPAPCLLGPMTKGAGTPLLVPAALWLFIPAKEASCAVGGGLSCCSISTPGWAPASCTSDLQRPHGFYSFWGCRNISAALQPLATSVCWKIPSKCRASVCEGGGNPPPLLFSPDCPRLVWLWLLWVCKIELYMTFYLTRNRLSHF